MQANLVLFSAYAFVASVTPGPGNIAIFAAAARVGFGKAISFLLGILSGFLVVLLVTASLSGMLAHAAPIVRVTVEILGALYLLYLSFAIWKSASRTDADPKLTFARGLVIHPLSVKSWTFSLTALSAFGGTGEQLATLKLVGLFFLAAGVAHLLWLGIGGYAHSKLSARAIQMINRTCAVLMAGIVLVALIGTVRAAVSLLGS